MGLPQLKLEDIPCMNLGKFVLDSMRKHDRKSIAMVDANTDRNISYGELIHLTERAASGLQKLGVRKGDVICILSPNHTDYMVAFYATALITATFQPVNPLYTRDDIKRVIKQCNTKFIMTVPEHLSKVEEAVRGTNVKVIVFGKSQGHVTFESLIQNSDGRYTSPACDAKNDVVAYMSSSGTTGFPKAVMLSHYAIVANTLQQKAVGLAKADDCYIMFLPLFHMYGLYTVTLLCHVIGAKIVIMSRFVPDDYLRLIQKYKPNMLQVVPPVMVMFSKYPKVSDYNLSSIQSVVCGAAPLSQEIEDMVKRKLKLPCIIQGYGMTEVGVTHANGKEDFRYKSVGRRLPLVEMKIVDVETGKTLGINEEGEIWVRGPQLCLGYLNLPEENKNFFTADGWARTGDIGKEDEDGYMYVVDRLKELIKYKGLQVAPATLEDILLHHDAIADVGVIGVPDEEAGELPRAYVVKKAGKRITEAEIVKYVNDKVSPHMRLRGGVEFVDEIPRTLSGKILRKTLRLKAKALSKL
ncbi:uncharacterized protein LOC132714225 [Ruditapes philippinarum]|uniref:uncharacterized protein LOC132714225 n=1 Tax=Ruditapes philippinarum TaxID=129788 RepID=UPI00295B586E|nr:uncharacterized protein LOC132714225 [Ruditapes philippinarum]